MGLTQCLFDLAATRLHSYVASGSLHRTTRSPTDNSNSKACSLMGFYVLKKKSMYKLFQCTEISANTSVQIQSDAQSFSISRYTVTKQQKKIFPLLGKYKPYQEFESNLAWFSQELYHLSIRVDVRLHHGNTKDHFIMIYAKKQAVMSKHLS